MIQKGGAVAPPFFLCPHETKGFTCDRVKSVGLNGDVKYTSMVNVKMGLDDELLSVYPNRRRGGTAIGPEMEKRRITLPNDCLRRSISFLQRRHYDDAPAFRRKAGHHMVPGC